mgnify:CR=1 FL=1
MAKKKHRKKAAYRKNMQNRLSMTMVTFVVVVLLVVVICTIALGGLDWTFNKAMEQLAKAFPGYKITAVDCNALIKQHGSLHCVTMQLPAEIINI